MDSKVTRCEQNLHEMDPCTKKCPPVKSIGFTGEPPGNSWFRNMAHAVDGLEIRGSPVEVGSLSHYLQGFIHPRWVFGISSINCMFLAF